MAAKASQRFRNTEMALDMNATLHAAAGYDVLHIEATVVTIRTHRIRYLSTDDIISTRKSVEFVR